MKKASLIAFILLLMQSFLPAFGFEGGDTGTYRILNYRMVLTPQQDGTTRIDYYQKWKVTDGHIPWITVGVPNNDYDIIESGMAVSQASPNNDGSDSLVRLDLTRDYQPGDTFEIKFSINQRQLFSEDENNYRIEFTPGWYDRSVIDSLEIRMKSLCKVLEVTADPQPSSQNDEMIWTKTGIGEGGQFTISFSFPKKYAPSAAVASGDRNTSKFRGIGLGVLVLTGLIVIFYYANSGGKKYSGGKIYRGGGGGSSCYYHSCACACACAGCACACACAGGGGAGCSRKLEHQCPVCATKERSVEQSIH